MKNAIGVLLTNTGTPDSPSVEDVRAYLKAFLSDPRVVRLPKLLWQPLLNGFILRSRPAQSAQLYRKIWTAAGSPLRFNMLALTKALERELSIQLERPIFVETGMHYGNPSIAAAIAALCAKEIEHLWVLPLFPQYSTSTTETTKAQVQTFLDKKVNLPVSFISHYAEHPSYLAALLGQIKKYHVSGRHLLFSFHGLPQRFVAQGDPYSQQCQRTVQCLVEALGLATGSWTLAYQSRLGYAKWLTPYTFATLRHLAKQGVREISVICPGFSVDCLETLEEIQMRGKETFLQAGGAIFDYIPALNSEEIHVNALAELVKDALAMARR